MCKRSSEAGVLRFISTPIAVSAPLEHPSLPPSNRSLLPPFSVLSRMNSISAFFLLLTAVVQGAVFNLKAPIAPASGGKITVIWSSNASDNYLVTIALFGDPFFNGPLAIANDISSQSHHVVLTLPKILPGPGYVLALLDTNTTDVLTKSPRFTIADDGPEHVWLWTETMSHTAGRAAQTALTFSTPAIVWESPSTASSVTHSRTSSLVPETPRPNPNSNLSSTLISRPSTASVARPTTIFSGASAKPGMPVVLSILVISVISTLL
ncbi:hypothetical protein B0H16DRAFT_1593145 [Mycena metata]|uniref:Uncharacterized protein n=1 Tax=Mycena metata TaxID=1033252 RepID=A0AAD7MNN5_9AGAR|nr:hypothetical protein B0H16DRAFT_1594099 [Mycena metata]KAJ7726246.1 hypothetical protein B0H16DRAFT_1593145 [Mycena metata]